jgi:hypothetical protein
MEPNENDGIFTTDASLHQERNGRSKTSSQSLHKRRDKSAESSSAPQSAPEQVPLLGNRRRSSPSRSERSDSTEGPVQWFGTAELQGLPWWKRPSVRYPFLSREVRLLTLADLLVATAIPALHNRIRRHHCSQA